MLDVNADHKNNRLWQVGVSVVYLPNALGFNRLTVSVMPGRTDDDKRVSDEEVRATAQRIGECLNAHDKLVAALREIASSRCPAPYPMTDQGLADYRAEVARRALFKIAGDRS